MPDELEFVAFDTVATVRRQWDFSANGLYRPEPVEASFVFVAR